MISRPAFAALALCSVASTGQAEVPNVVTDIAPIQSLAMQVMGDLGEPRALMRRGASPHDYALRPSDAQALQDADLVLWAGPNLAPWLGEMIEKVASDAVSVPLSELDTAIELPFREGATFEAHSHADDGEEDHENHEDEQQEGEHHENHDHLGHDPHSWLDPMNGRIWLGAIADQLADMDPENAATYRANATAAQARLDDMIASVSAQMTPLHDLHFIVFHDAYQYFEHRFGLAASGAISLGDATAPSPARIRDIQDTIKSQQVTCVFSEPQFSSALVKTVLDGTQAKSAVIDPLGVGISTGPEFYGALIQEVAAAFVSCVTK